MRPQFGSMLGGKLGCLFQKCHGRSLESALLERRRFSRNRHGVVWGALVPNTFFMNPSGFSSLASRNLSRAKAGQPLPMRSKRVTYRILRLVCSRRGFHDLFLLQTPVPRKASNSAAPAAPRVLQQRREDISARSVSWARKPPGSGGRPDSSQPANYFDIDACAPTPVGVARVGNAGVDILEGRG